MIARIKCRLIFLWVAVLMIYSCRKETSCENCKGNKPPISIAGPDQVITLPTDSVLLDGSASNDPDGTISEWLWKKISGPASSNIDTSTQSTAVVKNLIGGTHQFELKVTDNAGATAKDTVLVIVNDPSNRPPIANAGPDQNVTLPIQYIILDASNSSDPDNNIAGFWWSQIAGPFINFSDSINASQLQVHNLVEGVYLFQLKVIDYEGLWSKDTMRVIVNAAGTTNHPPVANAGADQTITLPANTIFVNGSASTDPDNNIISYNWMVISGPPSSNISNANAIQTQVTNLIEGTYQIKLKVTDAGGLYSEDTMKVIVMNQSPPCTNCEIVFVSDRDGNNEIYSCNGDGSNILRLTYDPANDGEPAWSPHGTRIAFVSDRTGHPEIYIMNADGSNVARKTFSGNYCEYPTWSPDGTRIAYSTLSNASMNIWVLNVVSGSSSLLFQAPGWDVQPAWSPDGTKIAFVSDWMAYDLVYDICTINADGTGFTALTGNIFDNLDYIYPSWSPGGTKLAMAISQETGVDQYYTQVAVMNPDGSGITALRSGVAAWTRTSWSGDGTRIAYTSLSGSRKDVSWVSADGSAGGTIVTNGWNADWKH